MWRVRVRVGRWSDSSGFCSAVVAVPLEEVVVGARKEILDGEVVEGVIETGTVSAVCSSESVGCVRQYDPESVSYSKLLASF